LWPANGFHDVISVAKAPGHIADGISKHREIAAA
jgi:hypothetical protein